MNPSANMGQSERATQDRIVQLLKNELGYRYLGNWIDRVGNSNIEEDLFTAHLFAKNYDRDLISRALHHLNTEAQHPQRDLYDSNKAVYKLLRYGVPVKPEAGMNTETVHLIDWDHPDLNDFAVAEEVTLKGTQERRPDLVIYVNGIAVAVIELKNSRVSLGDGIRQNLSNQRPEFNAWFFTTIQVLFAGNDSEGLRYGAIGTEEKEWLTWKEDEADNSRLKIDKYLLKMLDKRRFLELLHDFVVFDGGVKKLPRVHQYFGVKAAQTHVTRNKSGIIWHTQGSGKSLVMVLLAQWILENRPQARVVVVTDRVELDTQIAQVFTDSGETVRTSRSGNDLIGALGNPRHRLICSLVHKFGRRDVEDFDQYLEDLAKQPSPAVGEVFVFVDECHRTQSGRLHRVMKALLPQAVFIGFTGTPLLKQDKATSLEVFGGYIHTYLYGEAVEDGVVLDLVYEARDIDQRLTSQAAVDAWFEARTEGLNQWQKAELKKSWGTKQIVLSSRSRMEQVVRDIQMDFATKPRLKSGRGNAILVASSIFEACRYYKLFQESLLKRRCAIVTSYNPQAKDITKEDTGAETETDKETIYATYAELLEDVVVEPGKTKTETYESLVRTQFQKEPSRMQLLVVVDKLLTGFDAHPCTYLYIDKSMQDHGLFQAICRTNRLDGPDKEFGYIVDYKDLFKKVENALEVYTSELDHGAGEADPQIVLQDRLVREKERLEHALETLAHLCEPVDQPRTDLEFIHYFCGNTEIPQDLVDREPQRTALYVAVVGLVRAYGAIADDLPGAGYSPQEILRIRDLQDYYLRVRGVIRLASGESLDLKAYEADMRYLIDAYIQADAPRKISPFENLGLFDLIVKSGIGKALESLGILKGNRAAIAETIENNVRHKIVQEHLNNPAFYQKMSTLLDELIADRKRSAIDYEVFLRRIAELIQQLSRGDSVGAPKGLETAAKRVLYQNLQDSPLFPHSGDDVAEDGDRLLRTVDALHQAIVEASPNAWIGNPIKERMVQAAMYRILKDEAEVERLFPIVKLQKEYQT